LAWSRSVKIAFLHIKQATRTDFTLLTWTELEA
jgi:hypothetical protein